MKKLDKKEYQDILSKHKCLMLNHANASWEYFPSPKVYFECDNTFYIKEDNRKKEVYLFKNKQEFLVHLELNEREDIFTPLKGKEDIITDIDKYKTSLITNFVKEIKYDFNGDFKTIDLDKFNAKINKYTNLRDLYKNYYLNFIVFLGEFVRHKKGGHWEYKTNIGRPTELIPYFVDSTKNDYEFLINVLLVRKISEKVNEGKDFDLSDIIILLNIDWNKLKVDE